MLRRRNPIHDRLLGVLSLAVFTPEENEANAAKQRAIKDLQKVKKADLPKLRNIIQKVTHNCSCEDIVDLPRHLSEKHDLRRESFEKLRDILQEASNTNSLITPVIDFQPPALQMDVEGELGRYGMRATYEAHKEAAAKFSWDNYRHPWIEWQAAQDREEEDDGYEWFAEFEQASWVESMYEQTRTPPWGVWSQLVNPQKIFQLLSDLSSENRRIRRGAAIGLTNLIWPSRQQICEYATNALFYGHEHPLSLPEVGKMISAFFDNEEVFYSGINTYAEGFNIIRCIVRALPEQRYQAEFAIFLSEIVALLGKRLRELRRYVDPTPRCCLIGRCVLDIITAVETMRLDDEILIESLLNLIRGPILLPASGCEECTAYGDLTGGAVGAILEWIQEKTEEMTEFPEKPPSCLTENMILMFIDHAATSVDLLDYLDTQALTLYVSSSSTWLDLVEEARKMEQPWESRHDASDRAEKSCITLQRLGRLAPLVPPSQVTPLLHIATNMLEQALSHVTLPRFHPLSKHFRCEESEGGFSCGCMYRGQASLLRKTYRDIRLLGAAIASILRRIPETGIEGIHLLERIRVAALQIRGGPNLITVIIKAIGGIGHPAGLPLLLDLEESFTQDERGLRFKSLIEQAKSDLA